MLFEVQIRHLPVNFSQVVQLAPQGAQVLFGCKKFPAAQIFSFTHVFVALSEIVPAEQPQVLVLF
jgi:hypothetical protein